MTGACNSLSITFEFIFAFLLTKGVVTLGLPSPEKSFLEEEDSSDLDS